MGKFTDFFIKRPVFAMVVITGFIACFGKVATSDTLLITLVNAVSGLAPSLTNN